MFNKSEILLRKALIDNDSEALLNLLKSGLIPDINVKGQNTRKTFLHLAAVYGRADAIVILLQYNANPTITDDEGKTPLNIYIQNREHEITNFISQQATGFVLDTRDLAIQELFAESCKKAENQKAFSVLSTTGDIYFFDSYEEANQKVLETFLKEMESDAQARETFFNMPGNQHYRELYENSLKNKF